MLGLGTSLVKGGKVGRAYIKDGLKLYMPYKGADTNKGVQFVGEGSTYFVTNDYISCGNDSSLQFGTGDFSISAWIKRGSVGAIHQIVGYGDDDGIHWYLGYHSDNKLRFRTDDTSTDTNTYSSSTVADTNWHHISVTCDRDGDTKFYIDGSLDNTTDHSPSSLTLTHASDGFLIGTRNTGGSYTQHFDGSLKNIAIWNRALTATEVQNVMYKTYAEVSGRLASGLVSWWALDATGLGSDLVVNGGFDSGSGWDERSEWEISDGVMSQTSGVNTYFACTSSIGDLSGMTVQVNFDVINCTAGGVSPRFFLSSGSSYGTYTSATGTFSVQQNVAIGSGHNGIFGLNAQSSFVGDIDNLTVKIISVNDLKGSNDGSIVGATVDTDLYGSDTPVKPRAVDNSPKVQADAIGSGSAVFVASNTDYIDIGNNADLGSTDFTLTAWCKSTEWTSKFILSKWYDTNNRWKWGADSNDKLQFWSRTSAVSEGIAFTGSASLTSHEDKWVHLAITADRNGNISGYINGVLDDADAEAGALDFDATIDNSGNLSIGFEDEANEYFDGNICQVGIWRGVLTQEKIQSVMEKTFEELTATEKISLGDEIIGDGGFESGTDSWQLVSTTISQSTDYVKSGTYSLKVVQSGGSSNSAWKSFTTVIGKRYKYSFDTYKPSSGQDVAYVMRVATGADHASPIVETISTLDAWVNTTGDFTATQTTFYIVAIPHNDDPSDDTIYIDNVSVKEITHDLVSYWALDETIESSGSGYVYDEVNPTLGSNVFTGDNATFESSYGDWSQFRGVISYDDSLKAVKWTDNNTGSGPCGLTIDINNISAATNYVMEFSAKTDSSATFNFAYIGESDTFGTIANPNLSSSFQTYKFIFTTSTANERIYACFNGSPLPDTESYWMKDFSVKAIQGNSGRLV